MLRLNVGLAVLLLVWPVLAAERAFDFGKTPLNETPRGFRSTVTGQGKPGEWRVILDDVPPSIPSITLNAPVVTKRFVLAQLSRDLTDEHFPLLIFEEEVFGDFTFTTRFKMVSGALEQMAGVAFRIQDENNYYYVRASAKGNTFRFFKIVNGQRSAPIGPEVPIPNGVWHELSIECKGNQIRSFLNGKEIIPTLTDNSFTAGKIGFWTKSDSVSYFYEPRMVYTPREPRIKAVVRELMKEYPRLYDLRIYSKSGNPPEIKVVASKNDHDLGSSGETVEKDVLAKDAMYYGKTKKGVVLTMPLHDRNGEVVAAVRLEMQSFAGQTEQNALARALPLVQKMERRIQADKDLFE